MVIYPERRVARRDPFTVTVQYSTYSVGDGPADCTKGFAQTANISRGGLCIYTDAPFKKDQCMTLFGRKLSEDLLTATVKWCSKLSEGIYSIGLQLS